MHDSAIAGVKRCPNPTAPDDAHYVDLLGVLTSVLSIDDFHRRLGMELEPLPEVRDGEPSRRRPSGAVDEGAWVPTMSPAALDAEDADLYGGASRAWHTSRALSPVPDEARAVGMLSAAHYLSPDEMRDLTLERGLTRAQMELAAARVSAVNECFY